MSVCLCGVVIARRPSGRLEVWLVSRLKKGALWSRRAGPKWPSGAQKAASDTSWPAEQWRRANRASNRPIKGPVIPVIGGALSSGSALVAPKWRPHRPQHATNTTLAPPIYSPLARCSFLSPLSFLFSPFPLLPLSFRPASERCSPERIYNPIKKNNGSWGAHQSQSLAAF